MEAALDEPELVDQLVVISAGGDARGLDVFPKLFVASEGEPAAGEAERMAGESRGDWNALYLAPGGGVRPGAARPTRRGRADDGGDLARLEERR